MHVLAIMGGVSIVAASLTSAVRTLVLPRSMRDPFTYGLFTVVRGFFLIGNRARTYSERDRIMAFYAPIALLLLPVMWLTLVGIGYMFVFWGLDISSLRDAFFLSGSSVFTLGTTTTTTVLGHVIMFSEAIIGLLLMALLISFLPTMYAAFSRREVAVTRLEYRAGVSPSGVQLLIRFYTYDMIDLFPELWNAWENWFIEIEENHTSFPSLIFFRSPRPERSWITAAGVILDAAVLTFAVLDTPRDPRTYLCYHAGYTSLRRIASVLSLSFPEIPDEHTPITIARTEFDEACDELAQAGIPLKPDLDAAWQTFKTMRAHYDAVLVLLAAVTQAPRARWSSDRSILLSQARRQLQDDRG